MNAVNIASVANRFASIIPIFPVVCPIVIVAISAVVFPLAPITISVNIV